jgi:hypothetical protein
MILPLSILLLMLQAACSKSGKDDTNAPGDRNIITYTASTEDFPNPERGFYRYSETKAGNYTALDADELKQWRQLNAVSGGNYQVHSTLVFRYFVMDTFKSTPLSTSFLDAIKNDFTIAREAGVKLIPRFVYTTAVTAGACPEGFICPPYGDASKEIVLQHLAQLKPVLADGADVIAVVQLGLIGVWGENYYTDHFGDASQNSQGKLLDNNWQDRNEIIRALLDAVPEDRMIQVRYPQIKQRFIYGIKAGVTVPALMESEAFTEKDKARIGFHNDCFLASADDYGTYADYGNSTSPRESANNTLRAYMMQDSKYVPVGGETCDDTFSPQNDCDPAGRAETEMREFHYSYLNSAYNNAVNDDWQTGGCMENIKRNLGYRLVLKETVFPKEASAGEPMQISITLDNVGYASPFNKRPAILVLKSKTGGTDHIYDLNTDVRKWFSGTTKIEQTVNLDATLPKGQYDLFIWLPDQYNSIRSRSEYAIRLANENIWQESTGYNSLNAVLVIK